jgi:hypothetical protein
MKNVDKMKFYYKKLFFEKITDEGLDPKKYAIAGGAIRDYLSGAEVKDIDLFSNDKATEEALIAMFKRLVANEDSKVTIINENDALLNIKWNGRWFQLIKGKFYDMTTTSVIDSFDYTICCAMLVDDDLRVNPTFYQDTLAKHLRINRITFPLSTLERMQKYIQKGYEACNGTLLAVAQACAQVDYNNPQQDTLRFYPDGTPRFFGVD